MVVSCPTNRANLLRSNFQPFAIFSNCLALSSAGVYHDPDPDPDPDHDLDPDPDPDHDLDPDPDPDLDPNFDLLNLLIAIILILQMIQ